MMTQDELKKLDRLSNLIEMMDLSHKMRDNHNFQEFSEEAKNICFELLYNNSENDFQIDF